jgi:hypothetical protein
VPAGTLTESLATCHDDPINRASFQGPFLDPATIPTDNAGFTAWYRGHVQRFFGVSGSAYDRLFGLHELEHKTSGNPENAAFDGLSCDGSSNHIKLVKGDDGWEAAKDAEGICFKAHSFKGKPRAELAPYLIKTYSTDCYDGPPPIVESSSPMGQVSVKSSHPSVSQR